MTQINPYLGLNGKCREAMEFYKGCFGGELTMQPVKGSPMEAQCPPAMENQVLHAMLQKGGILLFGTDMVNPKGYQNGSAISLSLNCSSEEEIRKYFAYLSEQGEIIEPLKDQFWGAIFGCLNDKFGINWMLNFDKSQAA